MILSWLIGKENAKEVMNDNMAIQDLTLITEIRDSMLDRQVDMSIIKNYCCKGIYEKIRKLVSEQRRKGKWICGTCQGYIKKERSIICECCLMWSHFPCTGLKEKPDGDWFCAKCITDTTRGME